MTTKFRWFSALLVIVFFYLLILVFGITAKRETDKILDTNAGISSDSNIANLTIADKHFAIPKNYIWAKQDWKGGERTGTNLHAVLPEMEGYSELKKVLFMPGSQEFVRILLRAKGLPGLNPPVGVTSKQLYTAHVIYNGNIVKEEKLDNRLTRQYVADGKMGSGEHATPYDVHAHYEVYTARYGDEFYWVQCVPEGKVIYPSCNTTFFYSDHILVRYSFSKKQLSNWKQIDQKVKKLISEFDVTNIKLEKDCDESLRER